MRQRIVLIVAAVTVGSLSAGMSNAEDKPVRPAPSPLASLFNVDVFLNSYVRLVAQKYDLSEEQQDFTSQLVQTKAKAFINQHQDDLYELLERMFDVRAGDDMTVEELMAWGEQARPIYEEAKQIVIAANDEWRATLNEEQRLIHDGDVALMWDNFLITENHLDRIVDGSMTVEEFRNPPRYVTPDDAQLNNTPPDDPPPSEKRVDRPDRARPEPAPKPNDGSTLPPPKRGTPEQAKPEPKPKTAPKRPTTNRTTATPTQNPKTFETVWDKYVRDFIAKYKLNPAQTQKAEAILASCKRQGQQVVRRNEKRFEQIDAQLAELRKDRQRDKAKTDLIKRYEEQRAKLVQPLSDIFEKRLKPQLDKLPTRAQREAAEKKPEKKTTSKRSSTRSNSSSRK